MLTTLNHIKQRNKRQTVIKKPRYYRPRYYKMPKHQCNKMHKPTL